MSWNHRVIRTQSFLESYYAIHEVHYDDSGAISGWTLNPAQLSGGSLQDLAWALDRMKEGLEKPVLEEYIVEGKPVLREVQ